MNKIQSLYKWVVAAFNYHMNKNYNRDDSIWLFGAWGGVKYSDNSKYLYEYVLENHPNIRAIWITKDKDIYQRLKEDSKEVYLANTPASDNIIKQAGVAFFTNSLNDFGDKPPLKGAKICALFHGVGFKNELRELDNPRSLKSKLKIIKHRIYDTSFTSFVFTTSEFFRQKFHTQQYNAPMERIIATGQPRNDILFKDAVEKNNKKEKIILYLPTFREDMLGQTRLKNVINDMANSIELQTVLEKFGYRLIIKPHYLTEVSQKRKLGNISVFNDLEIPDIQEVLVNIDILITDYSSVIGDFVLLNRPMIFFPYDLDEYVKLKPMHPAYYEILKDTYVSNLSDLIVLLEGIFQNKVDYEAVNHIINNYINDPSLRKGGYSKKICQYMLNNFSISKEGKDGKSY